MEDPNPHYIHQLISKHLYIPIAISKKYYDIKISKLTFDLTISGSYENIYKLYEHIEPFNVKFRSITQTSLILEIGDFIRKIY